MEHDIPFGNSNRGNGTTFLDFPLFLGIFQWDEPTKRVPFTAEREIPEILTKWKAPRAYGLGKLCIPLENSSKQIKMRAFNDTYSLWLTKNNCRPMPYGPICRLCPVPGSQYSFLGRLSIDGFEKHKSTGSGLFAIFGSGFA